MPDTQSIESILGSDSGELLSKTKSKRRAGTSVQERAVSKTDLDETEIAEYRCPFCDYTRPDEADVRGHITRSSDLHHDERNGFSILTNVIALDADGNELDALEGTPTQLTDFAEDGDVSTELIPDNLASTDKQKVVLQTSILNPTDTLAELHRKVDKKVRDRGIDENGISYQTVREFVTDVLQRDVKKGKPGKQVMGYDDLSDTMRATVDQLVRYTDELQNNEVTQRELSNEINGNDGTGISQSNFSWVKKEYADIIEKRRDQYKNGELDPVKALVENPSGLDEYPDSESEPEPDAGSTSDSSRTRTKRPETPLPNTDSEKHRANGKSGRWTPMTETSQRINEHIDAILDDDAKTPGDDGSLDAAMVKPITLRATDPDEVTTDAETIADVVTFSMRAYTQLVAEHKISQDPMVARTAVAYKTIGEQLLDKNESTSESESD